MPHGTLESAPAGAQIWEDVSRQSLSDWQGRQGRDCNAAVLPRRACRRPRPCADLSFFNPLNLSSLSSRYRRTNRKLHASSSEHGSAACCQPLRGILERASRKVARDLALCSRGFGMKRGFNPTMLRADPGGQDPPPPGALVVRTAGSISATITAATCAPRAGRRLSDTDGHPSAYREPAGRQAGRDGDKL